jgi:hypothetical protein
MRVRHIFIVSTPLQVLNAREALDYYALDSDECLMVLIDNHTPANSRQVRAVIKTQGWKNVEIYPEARRKILARLRIANRSLLMRTLIRLADKLTQRVIHTPIDTCLLGRRSARDVKQLAKRCAHFDIYFMGYYGSPIMRHFENCFRSERVIILEEGSNQINLYESVNGVAGEGKPMEYFLNPWANALRRLLFRVKLTPRFPLTFFTAYDLPATDRVVVDKNSYSVFRSEIIASEQIPEVYFLGEWLTQWKCLTDGEYVAYLGEVQKHYPDQRLVFVPHRRTPLHTQALIQERLGIEVRDLGGPVELVLAGMNQRPRTVAAFFSSGLCNVAMLYSGTIDVTAFRIPAVFPQAHLDRFIRDFYKVCSSYFGDQISLISLCNVSGLNEK